MGLEPLRNSSGFISISKKFKQLQIFDFSNCSIIGKTGADFQTKNEELQEINQVLKDIIKKDVLDHSSDQLLVISEGYKKFRKKTNYLK